MKPYLLKEEEIKELQAKIPGWKIDSKYIERNISFQNEKLIIGVWQAIYLWEHRSERKERIVNIHAIGEKANKNYNKNNHS